MATSQAHRIHTYVENQLGKEVMKQFGLTLERFDKQLDECVGPVINRDDAADIIIKLFKVQWENTKE
jgi:hypothetical protein